MNKISAVIITFNEEKNLLRCLNSIADIVDEIVVVDSFSTDKTAEIAKQYGAKFLTHPFEGHIEQKNFALSQATFDNVLSLDADECLSEKLKESILKVKNEKQLKTAYSMNRLTNYCGRWIHYCGWYPDRKVRLFNRKYVVWGGENPHDKILLPPNVDDSKLDGDLLHYSYYTPSDHLQQIDKFTSIAANEAFKKGKRIGWFRLILAPIFKFLRDYILKKGFLDGFEGYMICRLSATATFMKYAKIRYLFRQQS
jgi:glycosyltransferase involved in cell wall biosynthesis